MDDPAQPAKPAGDESPVTPEWQSVPIVPRPVETEFHRERQLAIFLSVLAALGATFLCLWLVAEILGVGGEFRLFAFSALESVPFLPLSILAYLGQRLPVARMLTFAYWTFLVGLTALITSLLVTIVVLGSGQLSIQVVESHWLSRHLPSAVTAYTLPALGLVGVGSGVALGVAAFIPAVRRRLARVLPIDPDSFVHATALATVLSLTSIAFVPLVVICEPPGLIIVDAMKQNNKKPVVSESNELRQTSYALVWLAPVALASVGFPWQRNFREALRRVGLVRPNGGQLLLALVLVPMLFGIMNVADVFVDSIWKYFEWPTTDNAAFNDAVKFALSWTGAAVIGVTAGLGEELAVRGVLQPRLGILLSNLFFTSLHALQYNWDGLVSVFLIGLFLGVLRKYTNTTTSAIVHGGYDFLAVLDKIH
jgi:membrane protease YdiL (CAAX protease family)